MEDFWDTHYTLAEAGRKLGVSRQNIRQRALRKSIPSKENEKGEVGIPIKYVEETLRLRSRDAHP